MLPFANGYAYQSFPPETLAGWWTITRERDPHLAAQLPMDGKTVPNPTTSN